MDVFNVESVKLHVVVIANVFKAFALHFVGVRIHFGPGVNNEDGSEIRTSFSDVIHQIFIFHAASAKAGQWLGTSESK
jgi:hypothetical protein